MKSYNGFSSQQRSNALRYLNGEYAAGRRTRPVICDACTQIQGLLQAHSEDYSGPPYGANIGAFGLCYCCHMMIHCRFTAPEAWARYRDQVRLGSVAPNPNGSSFGVVTRFLNGGAYTWKQVRDPVAETLLDQIERGDFLRKKAG